MKDENWYEIYDYKGEKLIAPWHLQYLGTLTRHGWTQDGDKMKEVLEVYDEDGQQLCMDKNLDLYHVHFSYGLLRLKPYKENPMRRQP